MDALSVILDAMNNAREKLRAVDVNFVLTRALTKMQAKKAAGTAIVIDCSKTKQKGYDGIWARYPPIIISTIRSHRITRLMAMIVETWVSILPRKMG